MDDERRRIARARLLRRAGWTYDEIRAEVGPVGEDRLRAWLRGIPRPPQTRRSHPKSDARAEARRLRAAGRTYDEIAHALDVSKGTLSAWLRDVRMPVTSGARHAQAQSRSRREVGVTLRRRAGRRREAIRQAAGRSVGPLCGRELFVAGLALYWAEGSKDKPWRHDGRVVIINSDPTMFDVFLPWLHLMGVPEEHRRYRLSIHAVADVSEQERWWSQRLGVPMRSFARATLKHHNPTSVRRNTADDYHGCLIVSVRQSGTLYYAIEGWWAALSNAARKSVVTSDRLDPPSAVG